MTNLLRVLCGKVKNVTDTVRCICAQSGSRTTQEGEHNWCSWMRCDGTSGHSWVCALIIGVTVFAAACATVTPPAPVRSPEMADAEVRLDLSQQWAETGLAVHKGDRIVIWATGDAYQLKRPDRQFGPDGDGRNLRGDLVGDGGLVGRVDGGATFAIGSRTHLLTIRTRHSGRQIAPPPIKIERDGSLTLGIKGWKPGAFSGTFLVSIWRMKSS
jgi:hypothetical protein